MNAPFDEKYHYASQYLCARVCVCMDLNWWAAEKLMASQQSEIGSMALNLNAIQPMAIKKANI